jgi:hypothetical protein
MIMFSGSARFAGGQLAQANLFCLALVLGAAIIAAGCGKKSEKPSSNATPPLQTTQDTSQPAAPGSAVNSQPVPVALATNAAGVTNAAPDLKQLNHAYIAWIVQNRRHLKTFEEFVSVSGMQVPPPPAGKKYIIDHSGFIALVNQ